MGQKRHPQRTKAQHYVPQLYLRGFTNASGKFHCYDKAGDKTYLTCPHDAAQEMNFYEITPGTTVEVVPPNAVETQLGKLEAEWAPRLGQLIKSANDGKITHEQVAFFSPFVALQWIRTRAARDAFQQALDNFGQNLADDLVKVNFPGQDVKVKVTYPKEAMSAVQASQMLDPEVILEMARSLDRHLWVVGINGTGIPLYTSDHPVVRRANRHDGVRPLVGMNEAGIELAFPLDSLHLLLMLERSHFKEWRKRDCGVIQLTLEQVRDYNGLQVRRSYQRVYCEVNDFGPARRICAEDPGICDPKRPRVRVGSTPIVAEGETMRNYTYVIALE